MIVIVALACRLSVAKLHINKPALQNVAILSAKYPKIDKLIPSSGSGSGSEFSPLSVQSVGDVVEELQRMYSTNLENLRFDNCCQPKFLGLDTVSPSIFPVRGGSFSLNYVYCDMHTDGGGWMGIVRRDRNRLILFNHVQRSLSSYKNGFGKLPREYWIGLKNMHYFSSQPGGTELMVELVKDGVKYVAYYDNFFVESIATKYTLRVSGFAANKSNISDSLSASDGFEFVEVDQDTPKHEVAEQYGTISYYCSYYYGSWWFGSSGNESCTLVALTKNYSQREAVGIPKGFMWVVNGQRVGFDFVEMKIRPKRWECGKDRYSNLVIQRSFYSKVDPSLDPFNL